MNQHPITFWHFCLNCLKNPQFTTLWVEDSAFIRLQVANVIMYSGKRYCRALPKENIKAILKGSGFLIHNTVWLDIHPVESQRVLQ